MKLSHLALGLLLAMGPASAFANKKACSCNHECQKNCAEGKGENCECKTCDCSKTGKCKHDKCEHSEKKAGEKVETK